MIKTQKIMSPVFPAADCSLRLSVYATQVAGAEYLSMCLESKDTEKSTTNANGIRVDAERSCWCLFRMSVLPSAPEPAPGSGTPPPRGAVFKDSYGRFAADTKSGDNTSLGWNDFQLMSTFVDANAGYLHQDTATFSVVFHVIKENANFTRTPLPALNHGRGNRRGGATSGEHHHHGHGRDRDRIDRGVSLLTGSGAAGRGGGSLGAGDAVEVYGGKFVWRIDHFTRLKDLLKKRKITGLCIKSRRFQVGGRDLRLIIYPRGQSQPPQHLSMFLEVTHPRAPSPDWSCFVSHRLAVVCQHGSSAANGGSDSKTSNGGNGAPTSNGSSGAPASTSPDRSVAKESQNRYNRTAKDWGWREFITLTSLFDAEAGFLVNDSVVFSAEVLILKESSELRANAPASELASLPSGAAPVPAAAKGKVCASFAWRVENFGAFKEILETRKIFSRYFSAGGCELRIGVYESFDTLCIYLESEPPGSGGALVEARNYWVRYRIAVVHQRSPEKTTWRESSICTRTWNNSVLQFMKASEMVEPDAGLVARDTAVFACEVLECCPWFEFGDVDLGNPPAKEGAATTATTANGGSQPGGATGGDSNKANGGGQAPAAGVKAPPRLMPSADDEEPQAAADGGFDDAGEGGAATGDAAPMTASGDGDDTRASGGVDMPPAIPEGLPTETESSAGGSSALADPVATFRSLCARLGAHFAARDEGPPIVPSSPAFVAGAKAYVDSTPGASAALVAALTGFSRDPVRVRRLLLPVSAGGRQASSSGGHGDGADSSTSKCLVALLLEVPQLVAPVTEALLHVLASALGCNAGDGQSTPEAAEDGLSAVDTAWEDATNDVAPLLLAALNPLSSTDSSAAAPTSAAGGGDTTEESSSQCAGEGASQAHAHLAAMSPASTALVCNLLCAAPAVHVQGIAALASRVVPSSRHVDLVHPLLAAARVDGMPSSGRMAVLTALSELQLDPQCATAALQEALVVLPLLHEGAHLHAVAAFALRVASHSALRSSVLPAVRARASDVDEEAAKGIADAATLATQLSSDLGPVVISVVDAAWGGSAAAGGGKGAGKNASAGSSKGQHKRSGSSTANGTHAPATAHGGDADHSAGDADAGDAQTPAGSFTWIAETSVLVECIAAGASSATEAVGLLYRGVARGDISAACLTLALRANRRQATRIAATTAAVCEALARASSGALPACRSVAHEVFAVMASHLLGGTEKHNLDEEHQAGDDAPADGDSSAAETADDRSSQVALEALLHGVINRALSQNDTAGRDEAMRFLCDACGPTGQWCARVLLLVLRAASAASADAAAAAGKVRDAESRANAAKQAVADELASLRKERAAAQSRAAAAEATAQRARADLDAANEKAARERRETAEKMRSLEAQLSWTTAERADASDALVKERDAAIAQVKELDAALQRAKAAAKEAAKKVTKEKQLLTERATRAESAVSEAMAAAQRAAQQQQLRMQSSGGDSAATAAYMASMEAKLRASEEYIATLERSLAEESSRHAYLYGSGLDALSHEQLDALRTIHSDGLRAVASQQLSRQHEEQAAAAAAAAASAVVALGVDDDLDDVAPSAPGTGETLGTSSGFMALGGLVNGFSSGGHGLWSSSLTPSGEGGAPSLGGLPQWPPAERKDASAHTNRDTWF